MDDQPAPETWNTGNRPTMSANANETKAECGSDVYDMIIPLNAETSKVTSKSFYEYRKEKRGAIVHSLDVSNKHSQHAKHIIQGFRQGMYAKNVELHVANISHWIDQQVINRDFDLESREFLAHIILDMPFSDSHVKKAASVLHVNGNLIIFNPSVSQILSVVDIIRREYLPLRLDKVLELGHNMTGGKEWDVRSVRPRSGSKARMINESQWADDQDNEGQGQHVESSGTMEKDVKFDGLTQPIGEESKWQMVCRPKVGYRVAGGGFIGVWKKMRW